jgi:hypothetical protein
MTMVVVGGHHAILSDAIRSLHQAPQRLGIGFTHLEESSCPGHPRNEFPEPRGMAAKAAHQVFRLLRCYRRFGHLDEGDLAFAEAFRG